MTVLCSGCGMPMGKHNHGCPINEAALLAEFAPEIERLRHDLTRAMQNHSADLARLQEAEALLREASPALKVYSGEPDYIYLCQRIDAFLGSAP